MNDDFFTFFTATIKNNRLHKIRDCVSTSFKAFKRFSQKFVLVTLKKQYFLFLNCEKLRLNVNQSLFYKRTASINNIKHCKSFWHYSLITPT
jgi:hypothetical protein